jgi:hypothetical protein
MIRALRVARSTANRARTQAINALHALIVTAPEELRGDLRGLPGPRLVRTCAGLRPGVPIDPVGATKIALRSLARRHQGLSAEVRELDRELCRLTAEACPALVGIFGAGSDTAGALLLAAGDNPERLRSEAAFAKLTGGLSGPGVLGQDHETPVEPRRGPARQRGPSSDRSRQAPMASPTDDRLRCQAYTEGKSKREIIRCLKRYVAREVYRALTDVPADASSAA